MFTVRVVASQCGYLVGREGSETVSGRWDIGISKDFLLRIWAK